MAEYGITGTSSGLGAGLKRILYADSINRTNLNRYKKLHYDTLIHSGFERYNQTKNPIEYQKNALDLAKFLLDLNYKKFVFISSIDCNNLGIDTPYAIAKQLVEELIQSSVNNYQILRLPTLYGLEMKPNQVYKIATELNPTLSLSDTSSVSLIQYEDVAEFIQANDSMPGIQQLVSECLTLKEIANFFLKSPKWGNYNYQTKIPAGIKPIYSKKDSLKKFSAFINKKTEYHKLCQ